MSPEERDFAYLLDMLQYSKEVGELVAVETYESFSKNRVKRLAIERLIEIVGEAANHVSAAKQKEFPKVNWTRIIGMRNKLAHDYGEILSDRIWVIATTSVRELASILEEYGVKT